jgi:hypothetical protein
MTTTRKGITVKWETYTPTQAKAILADNANSPNRALSETRVRSLSVSWDNGEFVDTADTVKFDLKGRLIDGQHRLAAIARQGKNRTLLTARGLPLNAINVVDATGQGRSWGDVFHINGYVNSNHIASIARATVNMEAFGHLVAMPQSGATPTTGLEHLERRPDIQEVTMPFVLSFKSNLGMVLSVKELGTLYEIIRVAHPRKARMFCEEIATGQAVVATPAFIAYHQIRKTKADPRTKSNFVYNMAVLFAAWNDHMSGTTSRVKAYAPKPGAEGFPKPVGFDKWLAEGGMAP